MTRDLTQGDPPVILPGDPIRVPAWRLDELGRVELSRRETSVGPFRAVRQDVAQPSKTHATPERATSLADLILSLRGLGALALAFLAFLAFVLGAAVLTGLVFLAVRFVEWARYGSALGGAAVLGLCGFVIIATGVAGFLRITDPRRTR